MAEDQPDHTSGPPPLDDPFRVDDSLPPSTDLSPGDVTPASTGSRRRLFVVVVAVVAVVAAVIAGLALAGFATPTTISVGSGTATISWKPVTQGTTGFGNAPQPFTGTIEGIPLSGVATTPGDASSASSIAATGTLPGTIEFFQWKGTFIGKPFDIGLYATYPARTSITSAATLVPKLTIKGTWGTRAVNGHIAPPTAAQLANGNGPVHFVGTVGEYKVVGTIPDPSASGTKTLKTGTATFTISR